jgi:hypothetical protein
VFWNIWLSVNWFGEEMRHWHHRWHVAAIWAISLASCIFGPLTVQLHVMDIILSHHIAVSVKAAQYAVATNQFTNQRIRHTLLTVWPANRWKMKKAEILQALKAIIRLPVSAYTDRRSDRASRLKKVDDLIIDRAGLSTRAIAIDLSRLGTYFCCIFVCN